MLRRHSEDTVFKQDYSIQSASLCKQKGSDYSDYKIITHEESQMHQLIQGILWQHSQLSNQVINESKRPN